MNDIKSDTRCGKGPFYTWEAWGIELLTDIKSDTSAIKVGIDSLNAKFDTLNSKFDSFIHVQEEHNLRLEKILEKLAER